MHQILFDNWKLALLAKIFYKHKKKTESIGIIEIKSREKMAVIFTWEYSTGHFNPYNGLN